MGRRCEKLALFTAGGIVFIIFEHVVINHTACCLKQSVIMVNKNSALQNDVGPAEDKGYIQKVKQSDLTQIPPGPSGGKTKVYRFDGTQLVRLNEFCTWSVHLDCVMLKTSAGTTPIHIHDVKVDAFVSGRLRSAGHWDPHDMKVIMDEMMKEPEVGFIDLGSHVGAFSLTAAKLGRKVLSVDPLIENLQRLCKSVQKGGFTNQMTLVLNPLSDSHTHVSFKTRRFNLGATTLVLNASKTTSEDPCSDVPDYPTATLDDLIPILSFRKAVMKMDVEQHEFHVVNGGSEFFKEVNVTCILMEWERVKRLSRDAENLIYTLQGYGYKVYEPRSNVLLKTNHSIWPANVIWRK